MSSNPPTRQPVWNAKDHPGLALEQRFDANGHPTVATLSHPELPFVRFLATADAAALRGVADAYLKAVRRLGIIQPPLPATDHAADSGFGWLDITWGDPERTAQDAVDPRLSYWVGRDADVSCGATLVLLAGNRHRDPGGRQLCEGAGVGLRVVMHLSPPDGGGSMMARVTSMSVSGWSEARPPDAPPSNELTGAALEAARRAVARTMGFDPAHTVVQSALVRGQGDDAVLALSGVSIRHTAAGHDKRLCTWSTEIDLPLPEPALPLRCRRSWLALQTSGLTMQDGLDDAALRRAARRLPRLRRPSDADGRAQTSRVEVIRSTLDEPAATPAVVSGLPDRLDKAGLNDVASAHATLRADELFSRLDAWGLRPAHTFKLARLPLKMMPRAGFPFQPDGLTTNAMVQATGPGPGFDQPHAAADRRPQLEVRFGVASTTRGRRVATAAGTVRTEYRSLAADPRWAWHEFAHVLQFAATGELEFRFAHSVGDALAAIVDDPAAPLDDDALRGATFPASRVPRRHDRPALQGWCWCGERSRLRRVAGRGAPRLFGGYFEEQLMSSSLFRLYRAAGGDTPDAPRRDAAAADSPDGPPHGVAGAPLAGSPRRRAAEATLYLIVRAIQLLGPATLVPAVTASQFVTALVDADIGTQRWTAGANYDGNQAAALADRLGGTLHKVIRWAFEQQGLYATEDVATTATDTATDAAARIDAADVVREGAGLPPPVDLYIPGSGARADGGYHPLSLRPDAAGTTAPAWHTDAKALWVDGTRLQVQVGNRGRQPATDVRLRAWHRRIGKLSKGVWQPLGRTVVVQTPLSAGSLRTVPLGAPAEPGDHEVLVMVSGRGDLSNLDPQSRLPCAATQPPKDDTLLTDLLVGDNNLALRCITIASSGPTVAVDCADDPGRSPAS
jgi:hypothetical protein